MPAGRNKGLKGFARGGCEKTVKSIKDLDRVYEGTAVWVKFWSNLFLRKAEGLFSRA